MKRRVVSRLMGSLRGRIELRGDKSVSIRRALLTLCTDEDVALDNYGSGEDCLTALLCLEQLGKQIERSGGSLHITGPGEPYSAELDCRNSGTTARLLMGMLAGRRGEWILTGDESLSRRPMERVAEPLRRMGAQIELKRGCLPARVMGRSLRGIEYTSRVASAQVKSACLLAGMFARGNTRYREPAPSRDHTERLLGIDISDDGWILLDPRSVKITSQLLSGFIPADISSAAFWGCAASIFPGSRIEMWGVLDSPMRNGWLNVLQGAGGKIDRMDAGRVNREFTQDLTVTSTDLREINVTPDTAASVIDEIPILAAAATHARGVSCFEGVGELRVKESDRLNLIVSNLTAMGADVRETEKGFSIAGPCKLHGAEICTEGDHRIAMAFAIAGLVAEGETLIHDADCVSVSYPEFWDHLQDLTQPGESAND